MKLDRTEKMMIATAGENYTGYRCSTHKVFFQRNDSLDGKCSYCKKACNKIDNIEELKRKYIKELEL